MNAVLSVVPEITPDPWSVEGIIDQIQFCTDATQRRRLAELLAVKVRHVCFQEQLAAAMRTP